MTFFACGDGGICGICIETRSTLSDVQPPSSAGSASSRDQAATSGGAGVTGKRKREEFQQKSGPGSSVAASVHSLPVYKHRLAAIKQWSTGKTNSCLLLPYACSVFMSFPLSVAVNKH